MPLHPCAIRARRCGWLTLAAGLATGAALASLPRSAAAQPGAAQPRAGDCYGFAFGPWTPELNLRAAGHRPLEAGAGPPSAPGGRDWAAAPDSTEAAGQRAPAAILYLFPAWWPAGVHVALPPVALAPGDTVRGLATAFVADGRARSPTSVVRAWLVACGQERGRGGED